MTDFWRSDIHPESEPFQVRMIRDKLVDSMRGNRIVPLKIYAPVDHGIPDLPVIIWSHGLGGSADGAAFLSRYIAAHGYVVVHVQHIGTDSGLWEGKPGHPWDIIRATHIPRSATIARYQDVPFVLDMLQDLLMMHEEVGPYADLSNLGMSGHSFGALTSQVMLGQLFPDEQGILQDYSDPRFKCGIFYSMVPEFHLSGDLPSNVYKTINRPAFYMTGTDDSSPVEGFGYEKRMEVYEGAGTREKYLMILKDGDHMVYNGSRGKLGQNPNRSLHETLIKMAALAYWDYKLKGDGMAGNWLTGGGFDTYLNGHGEFRFER